MDKSLLIKGIAGVAAIGAGGTGFVYREEIGDLFRTKVQAERRKINVILGALGIECELDDKTDPTKNFSKECGLDEEKLGNIKFSNKGNGKLKIDEDIPQDLKIKIEGTKEDIGFSFLNIPTSSPIKLYGDKGKILLKSDKKFKNVNGKLTKDSTGVEATHKSQLEEFNKQLEIINAPLECRFDETERDTTAECSVASEKLKKIVFSNKGREDLKIVGEVPTGLKLKVEKDSASQNAMSLSFEGVTSDIKLFGDKTKGKIVVKKTNGSNKKFKVEGGKLTKDSTGVDAKLKSKLEEFNKQLGSVNAPQECRFDEIEGETSVECSVAPDELKKIAFSNKGRGDLTYSSDSSDFTGMKLKVNTHEEMVNTQYGTNDRVMYLTFKDYNKTVKLMKGNKEVVSLVKGTNPEFEIYKEDNSGVYLVRELWTLDYLWPTLGLKKCTLEDGKTQGECTFDDMVKTIKVKKENVDESVELTVEDTTNNKLEIHKDQEGFNQGFKFIFKGKTVTEDSATLESDKEYEFKWKLQSNTKIGYLSKKST